MHFSSKLLIFKGSGKSTEENMSNFFVKFLQEKNLFICLKGALMDIPTSSYCFSVPAAVLRSRI